MTSANDDSKPRVGPYDLLQASRRFRAGVVVALVGIGPLSLVFSLDGIGAISPTRNRLGAAEALGLLLALLAVSIAAERYWRRKVNATYSTDQVLRPESPRVRAIRRAAIAGLYVSGIFWTLGVLAGGTGADLRIIALSEGPFRLPGENLIWIALLLGFASYMLRGAVQTGEPDVAAIERAEALKMKAADLGTNMDVTIDELARRIDDRLSEIKEIEAQRQVLREELRPALLQIMQHKERQTARSALRLQIIFFLLGLVGGIGVNLVSSVLLAT